MKIVVWRAFHYEARSIVDDYIARVSRSAAGHELVICDDVDCVKREIVDAEVLVGWRITQDILAVAEKLKWIQFGSAGIDHTVFPELIASDIILTNLTGIHAIAVSEHTLALMLALTRKLDIAIINQKKCNWDRSELAHSSGELFGKTVGIIGLGNIGRSIARLCKAFGMRVIGTRKTADRSVPDVDEVYLATELDHVLAESDFLILVAPLTSETHALLGPREIGLMKDGACLVNVARGAMVDHDALAQALASGKLAGVALDVFPQEPLPSDSPIWNMPNAVLTPHTAGATSKYSERAAGIFDQNLKAFVTGSKMINVYNRERGY